MPVKSPAQFRLMESAANGNVSSATGPSKAVADEFLNATPSSTKSNFASGKFTKSLRKNRKVKPGDTYTI